MLRATLAVIVLVAAGCGSGTESTSVPPAASAPAPGAATPATAPAPVLPAPAVTQASWAPDALEELLAPIALYPDALLGQILAASINSQEVLDAGNWLLQNQDLKGDQLDAAAQKAGFGPATRALVQFPTVVDMMCQQIDWTRQLGSAFTSDQKSVLDAVQRLRAQAADAGNLKSTPEQKVETKKDNGNVIVEVQPADPKVVYVPQYDPQQVYTTSPPVSPPQQSPQTAAATSSSSSSSSSGTVSTGAAVAGGLLAFGVGVMLGNALDDDDCYPHWGAGVVYYGPRPFYPPAYVYRPVYGPTFHPAYRYAPPPGYRYSYNNVNVNVNRNIVVNHDNYFNRFENNRNLRVDNVQSPLGGARQTTTQNRLGQTAGAARTESWRGQSTYAGARNEAKSTQARTPAEQARSGATQARSNQDRVQHVDRGYGESTRTANRGVASHADRASFPAAEIARQGPREHAFSGATREGSGEFERAASARGRASAGERSAHVAHPGRQRG